MEMCCGRVSSDGSVKRSRILRNRKKTGQLLRSSIYSLLHAVVRILKIIWFVRPLDRYQHPGRDSVDHGRRRGHGVGDYEIAAVGVRWSAKKKFYTVVSQRRQQRERVSGSASV